MTIIDVLTKCDARLSLDDKWLVINHDGEFIVYQRRRGAKASTVIYRGNDEHIALVALTSDQE